MSTTGDCKVCIVAASPLQGAAVVGVLVHNGIVVGVDQLHKRANKLNRMRQEAFKRTFTASQVDEIRKNLVRLAENAAETRVAQSRDRSLVTVDPRALQQQVERVRSSLADAGELVAALAENERQVARQELQLAIASGRAILPQHAIQQAERALAGTAKEMQESTRFLAEARRDVEAGLSESERRREQLDHQLQSTTSQLFYINQMLAQAESADLPEFAERSQRVTRLIGMARSHLRDNLDESGKFAAEARQVAQTYLERASEYLLDGWRSVQEQVNTSLDQLSLLKQMVQEADSTHMGEHDHLQGLTRRVEELYSEAQSVGRRSSLSGQVQLLLTTIVEHTESLKEELFDLLQKFHQYTTADGIKATLTDLGFQGIAGDQPVIEQIGEMMHIAVVKPDLNAQGRPDNKLVEFDVTKDGKVSYDFSGYLADACIIEAERIFAALRTRGIYLLAPEVAEKLHEEHPGGLTRHELERAQHYPHPMRNKIQTELAERLQQVLRRMQYENVYARTIAGSIELDAFNGTIGYHVILEPEGTVQVYKDAGYVDISSDPFDPIVAESQLVIESRERLLDEEEPMEGQSQKQKERRLVDQRQKRMLEH